VTNFEEPGPTRRDVVKAGGIAAAALSLPIGLLAGSPSRAADADRRVAGVVFEDRSGSGRRQPGDAGIAGVLVSNGRDVAKTDDQGRYTLPVEDQTVIFVIKPTGYALALDEHNLPRFSYIHQPKGTLPELGLRFRGIDPTGPLPDSVDFGLRRVEEPAAFDVILFTDTQPESQVELDFVRDAVVTGVIGSNAAFGMTTGDVMFDDLSLYARYNRIIGQIGVPWFHIGGNHDLNFEAPDARYSRETFKRVYGAPYYAFNHGNALFLMLDNVNYLGSDPTKPRRGGKYEGRFGERQLAFIAAVLEQTPADRLVVLAMHIPLKTDLDPRDPAVNTVDRVDLFKLLGDRPVLSLSGHTHTTEHHYLGAADGVRATQPHHHHVLTAVSGSWWSGPYDHRGIAVADSRDGSPNGFHVLSIDGNRYVTRFVPASEPNGRQMRISLDSQFHGDEKEVARDYRAGQLLGSPISAEAVPATELVVNFFDGGARTNVTFQIGVRSPVPMTRVRRPDPFVTEVFMRNEATKKPWVKAEPCSHLWTADLPADLEPGTHCVRVRVTDEYGREHRDQLVLEVAGVGERTGARRT
jgi:3',5'-cyclic AMP phosphodiesterase CpdA